MKIKNILVPTRSWSIPSQSDVGTDYTVELLSDNSLSCNCMAGMMARNCHHKQKVRDFLQINEQETYEKIIKPRKKAKR